MERTIAMARRLTEPVLGDHFLHSLDDGDELMSSVDAAIAAQLKNIETRTGKTLDELGAIVRKSGLTKHAEIRDMLKKELGMGHGDANTLVHHVLASDGAAKAAGMPSDDVLGEIYSGAKAPLRAIHERLMEAVTAFGEFEIAPKKGYLSLRRKKQFAMIGPGTNTRVDVGLNMKGVDPTARLTSTQAADGVSAIDRKPIH